MSKLQKQIDFRLAHIRAARNTEKLREELVKVFKNLELAYAKLYDEVEGRTVTYTTNMNTDVAGYQREIVSCSTDSKEYICTKSGKAGHATWAALN